MGTRQKIILYGNSILLEGMFAYLTGASLPGHSQSGPQKGGPQKGGPQKGGPKKGDHQTSNPSEIGFEVTTLASSAGPGALLALNPGVVIFDVRDVPLDTLQAQMVDLPDLLLIGLDPESHAVLLAGSAASSISPGQIVQILCTQTPE